MLHGLIYQTRSRSIPHL